MDTILLAPITDDLTDAELVALTRQGQGGAFALIMRRNNRRLFRMVRAIVGNDVEAEEVVQETYVRAFTALDRWRAEASLATWLGRIALNEALSQVRRRRVTVELEMVAEAPGNGASGAFDHLLEPSPEAIAAQGEIRHLIEHAIDELPADFRIVFVLRAIEQLSVEETAATLAVPPETVRTRFFRARLRLRRSLGRRLAGVLEGAFPFAGRRCDRTIEAVLKRLALPAGPAVQPASSIPDFDQDPPKR